MTETTQLQKTGIMLIRPTITEMSEMALRKDITPEKRAAISTFLDKLYLLVGKEAPHGFGALLDQISDAMDYIEGDGYELVNDEYREDEDEEDERAQLRDWWHSHVRAGTTR